MIGIIGHGNIGTAISTGLLNSEIVLRISDHINENVPVDKNVIFSTNRQILKECEVIFICISPIDFNNLAEEIKDLISEKTLLVSLSPTHSLNDLKTLFNHESVIRYMPNTSISVNKGVSIISHSEDIQQQPTYPEFIETINTLGYVHHLDESLVNSTIGVAGSGIAIVFELLESMGMGGILNGLPQDLSYKLAAQTLIGAGEMFLKLNEHPAKLRDQVCSPGGITIRAVSKLEELNFKGTVISAIKETI